MVGFAGSGGQILTVGGNNRANGAEKSQSSLPEPDPRCLIGVAIAWRSVHAGNLRANRISNQLKSERDFQYAQQEPNDCRKDRHHPNERRGNRECRQRIIAWR